jgi:hypothetical protein
MMLPTASKALAPLLWLLASESADGNFDGSIEELMFRLRMSESDIKTGLKSLIDKGFFVEDSAMLAKCKRVAIPETETETETETDFVAAPKGTAKAKRLNPDWVLPKDWGMWTLEKMGWDESAVRLEAERFKDYWIAKSGRDATKLDWQATWRNWCRTAKTIRPSFAQQAADIVRTTVPPMHTGPDPVLLKIEEDRKKAAPMPAHIRQQINSVLRKA